MWLLQLDLLAYGRFTDVTLPLGPGFHLVYGPNEAGKSTTLRAIRQLLFGFDERTNDNFVHANPNLRIGGIVCEPGGTPLHVIRRKGRKDTLRAADDIAVVDPNQWQSLLLGIDEALFSQRYGIDYAQLIQGGREIATGSGDLGEILFATGSGVQDLSSVQQRLDEEAGAIFKPKGSKQRLNLAIADWQKQRSLVAERQLSIAVWEEKDRERQQASDRIVQLTSQLSALKSEIDLLRRWSQAQPLVEEISQLEQQSVALASVRRLPDDFESQRQHAMLLFKQSQTEARTANESLRPIEQELEKLCIPEMILTRTDDLNRLFAQAGSNDKAQQDRALIAEQHAQQLDLLKQLRESQTAPADGWNVAASLLDRSLRTRIQQLGRQQAGLALALAQAEGHHVRLQAQIREVREQSATIPADQLSAELRAAVRQVRSEGDLESRLSIAQQEITQFEQELENQLTQLKPWQGLVRDLKTIRVPDSATINRWEGLFETHRAERSRLESLLAELQTQTASLSLRIKQLQQEFQIPTENDLQKAREHRDATWTTIRDQIQSQQLPPISLVKEFDAGLLATDRLADRLRSDAERVAQLADHLSELTTNEARQREIAAQLAQMDVVKAGLDQGWQAEWSDLKVSPLPPREMQSWLARRELILQQETQLSRKIAETDSLRGRSQALAELLANQLSGENSPVQNGSHRQPKPRGASRSLSRAAQSELAASRMQKSFGWDEVETPSGSQSDEFPTDSPWSLSALLAAAEERLELEDARERSRQQAGQTLARLETESAQSQEQLLAARNALSEWTKQWHAMMRQLTLDPESAPDVAIAYVETLFEWQDHQKQADQLRARMDGIDKEAGVFREFVKQICREVAPELVELNDQDAVSGLRSLLANSLRDQARFKELTSQKQRLEQQIAQATHELSQAQQLLAGLCERAGIDVPPEARWPQELEDVLRKLAHAAEQSKLRLECEARLENDRRLLRGLAGAEPINDFIETVQRQATESIPPKLNRLTEEAKQIEADREALRPQLARIENQLSQMTGSHEAADAEESLRQIQAQIRSDAEHFIRIKLASSVLRAAIERYRETIRGPVLSIASELFRELTLSSFDGLRVEDDDQGRPMLVGLRSGGRDTIPVSGMSEGTCDQLYLALRLASLKLEASPRNRLPFILDDILIQFDDARATAALRVLAQFGQSRQVIYFTHHEHLLDIARRELQQNCCVHSLSPC